MLAFLATAFSLSNCLSISPPSFPSVCPPLCFSLSLSPAILHKPTFFCLSHFLCFFSLSLFPSVCSALCFSLSLSPAILHKPTFFCPSHFLCFFSLSHFVCVICDSV